MRRFTVKTLCNEAINIAKEDLKIDNISLQYTKMEYGDFGYYDFDGHIVLNERYLKPEHLANIIDTIFHEIKHLHQDLTWPKKHLHTRTKPVLPIPDATDIIYSAKEKDTGLDPEYLYSTCQRELNASGYAYKMTVKIMHKLIDECKNRNGKRFLKKMLSDYNFDRKVTVFTNKTRLRSMYKAKNIYQGKVKHSILGILQKYENDYSSYEMNSVYMDIGGLLSIYCDDEIQTKVFDYAVKNKNHETLYLLFNSPYCIVTENMLLELFKITKEKNIEFEKVYKYISLNNRVDVEQVYAKFLAINDEKSKEVKAENNINEKTLNIDDGIEK